MSAWIVSRETIGAIVGSVETIEYDFNGVHNMRDHQVAGQILWDENIRSVLCRYPYCSIEDAPGPIGEDYKFLDGDVITGEYTDIQIFKCIQCLDYQSCETNDWKQTEAYAILDTIKKEIIERIGMSEDEINELSEYDQAEWGI